MKPRTKYGEGSAAAIVNYRGELADRSRTGGWLAAGLILLTELSERVCVVGIAMNLVTYLVGELHLSTSKSANIVTNFMGTLNLLALLAGFVADAKFGRFLTTAISVSIAAAGASLLTTATSLSSMQPPACDDFRRRENDCVPASGGQLAMVLVALYTIAAGGGGIKANVSGFGSDQFDPKDPKEQNAMAFFFNRFYFCISLGSLFSATVLVYVQDNVGRGLGYGIAAAAMVAAMVMLIAGVRKYRFRRPQGSALTVVWRVMWRSWSNRGLPYPEIVQELNGYENTTAPHTDRFRWLDKAAILETPKTAASSNTEASTVGQVEEVKLMLNLLPIWATCILFWTIYSQMTTFSVEQATYMNRKIGSSFTFPSGSLSFFLILSILLVTSLNEKLLLPLARRFSRTKTITSLQRVGIGLLFSTAAMAVSALVEMRRREIGRRLSVFWLVPQFCLVGTGEGFAYVGMLEFFIREAPEKMKSMSTGLFLSTVSMGFFFSSALVTVVDKATKQGWIKNNLNEGKLHFFYCTLALLGLLNFIVFSVLSSRHQYRVQQRDQWVNQGDGQINAKQHGQTV